MCGVVRDIINPFTGVRTVLEEVTGSKRTVEAMNRQADATIAAAEQSADAQMRAMMAGVQASANATANLGRMEQARAAAAEAASQQIEAPEVLLQTPETETAREGARRRRATFGVGVTNTGVQL